MQTLVKVTSQTTPKKGKQKVANCMPLGSQIGLLVSFRTMPTLRIFIQVLASLSVHVPVDCFHHQAAVFTVRGETVERLFKHWTYHTPVYTSERVTIIYTYINQQTMVIGRQRAIQGLRVGKDHPSPNFVVKKKRKQALCRTQMLCLQPTLAAAASQTPCESRGVQTCWQRAPSCRLQKRLLGLQKYCQSKSV